MADKSLMGNRKPVLFLNYVLEKEKESGGWG